jgi:protein O-mannosyl-transferase
MALQDQSSGTLPRNDTLLNFKRYMAQKEKKISLWIIFSIIAVTGTLIYSNMFGAGFCFDDGKDIVYNKMIRDLWAFDHIWQIHFSRFIPVWTFALNYQISKLDPFGFHLFNIVVHILASFVVFLLVQVTFKTPVMQKNKSGSLNSLDSKEPSLFALFASLIFLCHPIQTQAVSYLVQRSASMAALFYLAAVYFAVRARLKYDKRFYVLAFVSAFAAVFSKENAFTLPFSLLLYEVCFLSLKHETLKKRVMYYWPFFIPLIVVYFSVFHSRVISHGVGATMSADTSMSHWTYLLTEFNVIRTYLRLLFIPVGQNVDYDYPMANSLAEPLTLFSVTLVVALGILGLILFRKNRLASFGILWFFLTLSLEAGIIRIKDVIFEHRLYLPMFGFAVVLTTLLVQWVKSKKVLIYVFSAVLVIFSMLTFYRNKVWQSEVTLWEDIVKKSPGKARSHGNLGNAYMTEGRIEEAKVLIRKAIEIDDSYPEAHFNLGMILKDDENFIEAEKRFRRSLELNPNYTNANIALGNLLKNKGEVEEAITYYNAALSYDPINERARHDLAGALMKLGRIEEARREYRRAVNLEPDYIAARNGLAASLTLLGNLRESIFHYQKVLEVDPENESAKSNVAVLKEAISRNEAEQKKFIEELKVKYQSIS